MTSPARTMSPLSKPTLRTVSLTFAVSVTDSFARAVPSASIVSRHSIGATRAVTTAVGGGASPAPGRSVSQPCSSTTPRAQMRKIDTGRGNFHQAFHASGSAAIGRWSAAGVPGRSG